MSASPRKLERSNRILKVAGQLFARQGYHATSTREIARIADVSEITLFRHFEHKEGIFWAALGERLRAVRLRREFLDGFARCESPEIVLPQLIAELVDTAILNPEILRLVGVAFIELQWKAGSVCREQLSSNFSAVMNYLRINIERGKLRNLDPAMITAALCLTVFAHFEIARFVGDRVPPSSDSRDAIRSCSKFWLEVLIPS